METLSYGANTIRDGANISQRYSKESVVSGSQIMFLKTGEAFLKLYGIETIGKVMFKYHERKSITIKSTKKNLSINDKFIDVSEKDVKEVAAIIAYLRSKYAHAIIVEKGNKIRQKFAENIDIILDPINGPYSWDIIDEFKEHKMQLIDQLLSDCDLDKTEKSKIAIKMLDFAGNSKKNGAEELNDIIHQTQKLNYLEPLLNDYQKVSLARYVQGNGNILMFVPCFENPDLIKVSNIIAKLAAEKDVYIIKDM